MASSLAKVVEILENLNALILHIDIQNQIIKFELDYSEYEYNINKDSLSIKTGIFFYNEISLNRFNNKLKELKNKINEQTKNENIILQQQKEYCYKKEIEERKFKFEFYALILFVIILGILLIYINKN